MSPKKRFILAGVFGPGLFLALIGNCFWPGREGPQGPEGPELRGTLYGFVTLIKANGDQPADRSGVRVSADWSWAATQTDSAGEWAFSRAETGIYTLTFSKDGYGTSKEVQVQFVGGGDRNIGTVNLCEPPAFFIDSVWTRVPKTGDTNSVYLGARASDSLVHGQYKVILFFSHGASVSRDPASYLAASPENTFFIGGIDSTGIRLQPVAFASAGFQSGDTLYTVAYAASAGSENSGYLDLSTNRFVYTNIDTLPSNRLVFVVP